MPLAIAKILLVVALILFFAVVAALSTLAIIARARGVSRVPVPSGSLIQKQSAGADYVDSYAATVPATLFADSRALARHAFQRCSVAGETEDEIMYTGASPGLVYHISYFLRRGDADARLFVSTTVHYKNWRGRVYFGVVRPGHRVLTPFMTSVMIRKAATEAR